jgi:hypothetical protein
MNRPKSEIKLQQKEIKRQRVAKEKANRKLGEQELAGEIEIQTGAAGQIP